MNITWYFFYLLLFVVLSLWALVFRSVFTGQKNDVALSPLTILVASYLLYSSSLPLSRIMHWGAGDSLDLILLRMHLMGFIGFAAGALVSPLIPRRCVEVSEQELKGRLSARYRQASLRKGLYLALLCLFTVRYAWVTFAGLNYSLANIFEPYGFEQRAGSDVATVADVFVYFALYATLVFGVIWDRNIKALPRVLSVMTYGLIAVIAVYWLIRGSRNMATIILLPTVAAILYGRRIRVFRSMLIGLIIVASLYVVGGIRGLGMNRVTGGDLEQVVTNLDPLHGELGTSYNVVRRGLEQNMDRDLLLGRSYTYNLFLNLVPRSWWPNRPDNLAVELSKDYYNTDQLTQGLGFSPVFEAYLNFGEVGIIGVFMFTFLVIRIWEDWRDRSKLRNIMLTFFMLPMIINWNRIDLSTAFKMYSGYIVMAFVVSALYIRQGRLRKSRPRK